MPFWLSLVIIMLLLGVIAYIWFVTIPNVRGSVREVIRYQTRAHATEEQRNDSEPENNVNAYS